MAPGNTTPGSEKSLQPEGSTFSRNLYFQSKDLPKTTQNGETTSWGRMSPRRWAEEGCAVSSAAMVLAFYGQDIDPGRLNLFLANNHGYTPQGWLYWEKAADYQPGLARHVYEDLPSYLLIDSNLQRGNPVIVRIHLPNGITHFVVIVGKAGFDYLIQDPASGGTNGVYPLRKLAPEIEALRFYQKLTSSFSVIPRVARNDERVSLC